MTQYECCIINSLKAQLAVCQDALEDCHEALEYCENNAPPELIASVSAYGASPTVATDTTGANFIVINAHITSGSITMIVTDNKGNTWSALPRMAGLTKQQLFYAKAAVTGPGHIFTLNSGGTPTCAIEVLAFSNMDPDPFDGSNGAYVLSATTILTGSITPSRPNSLIITGLGHAENLSAVRSVDNGFVIAGLNNHASGSSAGGGIAYKTMSQMASHAATWTLSPSTSVESAATIAAFKWGNTPSPAATETAKLVLVTHNGNNIPLGLYQDLAATTPATAEGHPIRVWRDMRPGGLTIPLGSGAAPATLTFISGVPTVLFGAGQWFYKDSISFGLPESALGVIGYEYVGAGNCCVMDTGPAINGPAFTVHTSGNGYPCFFATARRDLAYQVSNVGPHIISIISNKSVYKGWVDGAAHATMANASVFAEASKICIGRDSAQNAGGQFIGRIHGIVIHHDQSKRGEIERYIKTLSPYPVITVLASTSKGTSAGGGHTDPIDTTNAKLIVLNLAYYNSGTLTGVHDSLGNTYIPLTANVDISTGAVQQFWYCENPITGPAHQFQINGATIFASVEVAAFALSPDASSLDQQAGAVIAGSTVSVGPVSQSTPRSLVLTAVAFSDNSPTPPDVAGFELVGSVPYIFGAHFGSGMAWKLSDSMVAHSANWDIGAPMSGISAGIATFKVN